MLSPLFWSFVACTEPRLAITPIGSPSGGHLHVFTASECATGGLDPAACAPAIDDETGRVTLGVQVRDPSGVPLATPPISPWDLEILHAGEGVSEKKITAHDRRSGGRLFVVLIDGSRSMHEGGRLRKVQAALLRQDVRNALLPPGTSNHGVMLMKFTDRLIPVGGAEPQILGDRALYESHVEEHLLGPLPGNRHVYDATGENLVALLDDPQVRDFIARENARPTVVLLTDGFNNEAPSDTCGKNARRLAHTVESIREARANAPIDQRFEIHTVGLGARYLTGDLHARPRTIPSPVDLCGEFAERRIDGDLDTFGVDHVSLARIAEAGGGYDYVKMNSDGIADALLDAARVHHHWFEVHYVVPVDADTRDFDLTLNLKRTASAHIRVTR